MAVIYLFVVLLIQDVMAVQQCDVESCAWKNIPDKAFLQCEVESCTPIKTPDKQNLRELPHFFDCSKLQFWNKELRIKNKACPARRPVYHCNYALEKYRYEELCWSFKIYLRKGERGIIIGGLHKWTCPIDRYQPFQSDSTIVNNCFYQKSLCTEEGQVPYRGHLPDQDRSCRCDYSKGYAFVVEPRNKCFCIPSEEDCSCYRKICPNDNYNLTQDYDCLEFAISQNFNCSVIKENDIFSPSIAERQKSFENDIQKVEFGNIDALWSITVTITVILIMSGHLFLHYKGIPCVGYLFLRCKGIPLGDLQALDTVLDEGDSIVLSFKGANQYNDILWLKNKRHLKMTKRCQIYYAGKRVTILRISDVHIYDSGKYAVQSADNISEEIEIRVHGKITIPLAIQSMSESEKEEFYKILEDGYEKRYYVKIFLVGKDGAGKTSLMRRLLPEELNTKPTDDKDIEKRCKIAVDDGEWIFHTGSDKREIILGRDLKETNQEPSQLNASDNEYIQKNPNVEDNSKPQKPQFEITQTSSGNYKNTTDDSSLDNNRKGDRSSDNITYEKKSLKSKFPLAIDAQGQPETNQTPDVNEQTVLIPKKQTADCIILNFSGHKEYYVTHQTFLNGYAIYLITASLKDMDKLFSDDAPEEETLGFWFDVIHCFASARSRYPNLEKVDPPIIAVCTKCDDNITGLESFKSQFENQLDKMLKKSAERRNHLRGVSFLSNTSEESTEFNKLKEKIYETATEMPNWGEDLPVRWIKLEEKLDEVKTFTKYPVMTTDDVVILAKNKVDLPQTTVQKIENEISLFLKYQHLIGNVVFFEDIKNFVILKPQWLSDIFRRIVCVDCFNPDLPYCLKETGLVKKTDICKLLSDIPEKYHNDILSMMEKFDIIVKYEGENKYVIPSMIKKEESSFTEIYENLVSKLSKFTRSSWLCLVFEFLPPALFNNVTVKFMRDTNYVRNKLWHNACMFDLKDGPQKLIICKWSNALSIQCMRFDNHHTFSSETIRQTLLNIQEVIRNTMGENRYGIQVSYKIKLMCSEHLGSVLQSRDIYELRLNRKFACEHKDGVHVHDSSEPMFRIWNTNLNYLRETKYLAKRTLEGVMNRINDKMTGLSGMLSLDEKAFQEKRLSQAKDILTKEEIVTENEINTMITELRLDFAIIGKRCMKCHIKPAVNKCHDCTVDMCDYCTSQHRTAQLTKSHYTLSMSDRYVMDYSVKIDVIEFSDITILLDGLLVIVDGLGKKLITYKLTGEQQNALPFSSKPFSITVVDSYAVAVTSPRSELISIVDINHLKIIRSISLKGCLCIMYSNNQLFVSCRDNTMKVVSLTGEIIRTIDLGYTPIYICGDDKEHIYCSDYDNNQVYCNDRNGNSIFIFTSPDMRGPYGLAIDNDGYILVACRLSNNVLRISPDGGHSEVIISQIQSFRWCGYPYICYDLVTRSVIICCDDKICICKQK